MKQEKPENTTEVINQVTPNIDYELSIPKDLSVIGGAVYAGVTKYVKNSYLKEDSLRESMRAIRTTMLELPLKLSPNVLVKSGLTESRIKESFLVELSAARLSLPAVENNGYQRTYDAIDIAAHELAVDKKMLESPNIAFKGYRLASIFNDAPKKLIASLALAATLFGGTLFADKAEAAIELSDLGRIALRAVAENVDVDYNSDKKNFSMNIDGEEIKDRLGSYAASAVANAIFNGITSLPEKAKEKEEKTKLNKWALSSIEEVSKLNASEQFTYLRLLYIGRQLSGYSSFPVLITCAYAVNPDISDNALTKICSMIYKNCEDKTSLIPTNEVYEGAFQMLTKYFPEFDKNDEMIRITANISMIAQKLHSKTNSKALDSAKILVEKSLKAISNYYDTPIMSVQTDLLKAAYKGQKLDAKTKEITDEVKSAVKDKAQDNTPITVSLEVS